MKKIEWKNERGITLIVLVVTMIVLLILAGVIIRTLIGDNGWIEKAKESEFKSDIASFQEELNIAIYSDYTEKLGDRKESNKFNAQGYDEIIQIIPNFKKSYERRIAIKQDKIVYIGLNETERKWLRETGVEFAVLLKINYIDENGSPLKESYMQTITSGRYYVQSPEIEGYLPIRDYVEGTINEDTEINVEYYRICNDLAFEGLDASGKVTQVDENIVSYAVSGIGNCNNPNLVIPYEYNNKPIIKINNYAFKQNMNIKNVIIRENIKSMGEKVFFCCSNLISANINSENVGFDDFERCSSLQNVFINNNVKKIDAYAFEYCSNLTDFIITSENIDFAAIGVFYKCTSLKELKVNAENKNYKVLDGILYSMDEKQLIQAPTEIAGDISISEKVEKIGIGAFSFNEKMTSIVIPKNVTEIGSKVFYRCASLENITIPESVKTIGSQIFQDCTNLKSVNLNSQATGLNTFWRCTNLEDVTIGTNCKRIENYCFETCTKLTTIKYSGTIEEWNSITKDSLWKTGADTLTTVKCMNGELNI